MDGIREPDAGLLQQYSIRKLVMEHLIGYTENLRTGSIKEMVYCTLQDFNEIYNYE